VLQVGLLDGGLPVNDDHDKFPVADLASLPAVMTTEEVAAFFRVCPTTITRRARRGSLPAMDGLRVGRFSRDVVIAAMKNNKL
jgi:Helix-turn-helix domain